MGPVYTSSEKSGNRVLTMAELAGRKNMTLEAEREVIYENNPPSEEFMKWAQASDEYKLKHPAPLSASAAGHGRGGPAHRCGEAHGR